MCGCAARRSRRPTRSSSWARPAMADDVIAEALVRRKTSADVRVPMGAVSGPVAVVDRVGRADGAVGRRRSTVEPAPPTGIVEFGLQGAALLLRRGPARDADLRRPRRRRRSPVTVALGARRRRRRGRALGPRRRRAGDAAAAHVERPRRRQGPAHRALRVPGHGAAASRSRRSAFDFARDRFPILGKFTFGTGVAAFGGGRGHQGHDVFAACGTPLVAAHGGSSSSPATTAAPGNYLVIDNEGTGTDHAYMHLRDAPLVAKDARVVHRAADRLRRRTGRGERVPPALRGLDRARAGTRAGARSTRSPMLRSWAAASSRLPGSARRCAFSPSSAIAPSS